jgi:apoptosis-stimulating of p53 protein 1
VRGNVAAVEPYNHTPQKSTSITSSSQQHQQIIQDLAMLKLKSHQLQQQQQQHSPTGSNLTAESDENKLARQKQHDNIHPGLLMKNLTNNNNNGNDVHRESQQVKDMDNGNEKQTMKHSTASSMASSQLASHVELNGKTKSELKNQTMPYNNNNNNNKYVANNSLNVGNSSLLSHKIISSVLMANNANNGKSQNECDSDKAGESSSSSSTSSLTNEMSTGQQQQQQSHISAGGLNSQIANSTPLNAINKSVAEPLNKNNNNNQNNNNSNSSSLSEEKPAIKPKALHQIPSGNLVVPPRKPISSVAPTSVKTSISQAPKIHMVAPNNNMQMSENDKTSRPALPPKPNKQNNNTNNNNNNQNNQMVVSNDAENNENNNNLPIKAKPLTIKKQPLSEQPKLRSLTSNQKTIQYSTSRRIEMPPAFLFPAIVTAELKDNSGSNDVNGNSMNQTSIISKLVNGTINLNHNNNNNNNSSSQDSGSITSADETDKSITPASTPVQDEIKPHVTDSVVKRKRNLIGDNAKAKLARRVSFDPLALLLDASLEGELELVRKTAMQVPNPSAANDEGITALHNAICAGHLEIVK